MDFPSKSFSTIFLVLLSGSFISRECCSILLSDVIYEDIESLNATCRGKDSCEFPRIKDTLEEYNCNCGSSCSLFGTCCADSKYRQRYPQPLKNVYCSQIVDVRDKKRYFFPMIYQCNPDLENDKTTEELCNSWEKNDPFLLIPVTDPVTGISYKNYYCFACNVNYGEEEPIPWNLVLESDSEEVVRPLLQNLHYDKTRRSWVLDYGQENEIFVNLKKALPDELKTVVPFCFNFKITSECAPDWIDDNIRKKCLSYMALTRIRKHADLKEYYRNPHCAVCNYERIESMECYGKDENSVSVGDSLDSYVYTSKEKFFFGLFYLHNEGCPDNMGYDAFAKKCRNIYRSKRKLQ